MTDTPHYSQARVALYLAVRATGVPDQFAGPIVDEALAFAARAASDYLTTVPAADRVVVTDHRSARLWAENPDMHRAQVSALGSKPR